MAAPERKNELENGDPWRTTSKELPATLPRETPAQEINRLINKDFLLL